MDNVDRERTSIIINKGLWKEAKKHCIDRNITISEFLEQLIEKELKIIR